MTVPSAIFLTDQRKRVGLRVDGDRLILRFPFDDELKEAVKEHLPGARWDPDDKVWWCKFDQAAKFNLELLAGRNPYAPWDTELALADARRESVFTHQRLMKAHGLHRPGSIWAADPGTGKTLAAIETIEELTREDPEGETWFVGPKSALLSVKMDFKKWKFAGTQVRFHSFHEMKKLAEKGGTAPKRFFCDEAHRLKNPESAQAKAAAHIADALRDEWGKEGRVVLMTGTPAPKYPVDWWMLCRIACPGFLKEGHPGRFRDRLAVVRHVEGESGMKFPKIMGWRDDERKCNHCARLKDAEVHTDDPHLLLTASADDPDGFHEWEGTENEVAGLYDRMQGLVVSVRKKDVLKDLPEKVFTRLHLAPSKYTLGLAKAVVRTAKTAAQARQLLRQLSSGFQYTVKAGPDAPCPALPECPGKSCIHCAGRGTLKTTVDYTAECDTPKDEALTEILGDEADRGRVILWGSFQAAIDRMVKLAAKAGWEVIRRDGRGWESTLGRLTDENLVRTFQREGPAELVDKKIAFIGHPASAGVGLTLTASELEVFWDNTDDLADRLQAIDRIHRPGSTGARYIDLCHLPIDTLILDKLYAKEGLQSMTLGDIRANLEEVHE